jgi:DNA sulfur modification protein DndB
VKKWRTAIGGSILFRPVGLIIFTHVIRVLAQTRPLSEAISLAARLPTDLTKQPYAGLLWDPSTKTLDLRRQVLVRKLLLYMLGDTRGSAKLRTDLAKAQGILAGQVRLPNRISSV